MVGSGTCRWWAGVALFALCWVVIQGGVTLHAHGEISDAPVGAFEESLVLRAEDLLPGYLLSGDVFAVESEVRNDGETNHYMVRSPLGDVKAAGRDELERSIQELRVLALLRETRKRTGAAVGFNQGMKGMLAEPYRKVKRVVFDPLYALEAVPGELLDYAGKFATVGDLFKRGPRVFIRRSLGIDGARKTLAKRLHVDESTDNDALRKEIHRVGWGVWAGGLFPEIGEGYVDLGYDLSVEVGDLGEGNLGRALAEVRREVVPRTARRMLKKMNVPKDLITSFRKHPQFSGRMRENIAVALRTMKETEEREAFIAWSLTLETEREARQALRLAQLMAVYNALEKPVTDIWSGEGQLLFKMENDVVVSPLLHDYLLWSEDAAKGMILAAALKQERAPDTALEVWSLGEVSSRTHKALSEQGYAVRTNVDEAFPAFERPRKGLKRVRQRYERRVEAPIRETLREQLRPHRKQRLILVPLGSQAGSR
ncbi:MAG: hypothetical protein L3K26_16225 [Candidatus Hydrogenedentes bacterium]|nr:hypothetical protein [Candidatus Hydrogenedentota bacterium]